MNLMEITETMRHWGFNAKERAYVYSGAVIGAIAPIVGARYILPGAAAKSPENMLQELTAWGFALAINAIPMIWKPHMPAPFYTGGTGAVIGTLAAKASQEKRMKKEEALEKIAN